MYVLNVQKLINNEKNYLGKFQEITSDLIDGTDSLYYVLRRQRSLCSAQCAISAINDYRIQIE